MSNRNILLKGTLVLTITGFVSRLIGFFFRMFLSHTFGEENVGLYQLIFPIYALCFSFTTAGIETSISRCVARVSSLGKHREARQFLYTGLFISLILSIVTGLLLQNQSANIALYILGDSRCKPLLTAITYALPFASIHSCICGYYLGLKQTRLPALSQMTEQLVRVSSVYIFYLIAQNHNQSADILFAVLGIVIGEIASAIFCFKYFTGRKSFSQFHFPLKNCRKHAKELLSLAIPLTSNRILLNILQSVESISIPLRLRQYGYNSSEALATYGVLTGMALPCILFPSAITNSVSTMLLPAVAEIQSAKENQHLNQLIRKVILSCFLLGFACCLAFLFLGTWLGNVLFHSKLAGDFILTLAWICPFLYMNSALISIINGLGKATTSLLINASSLVIRILSVMLVIPIIGMKGYLWGLLLSQLLVSVFSLGVLKKGHH